MQMVNEQVVKDTIQRMLDAGIDDSTIVSTLSDIGISDSDARAKVASVKSGGTASKGVSPVESAVNLIRSQRNQAQQAMPAPSQQGARAQAAPVQQNENDLLEAAIDDEDDVEELLDVIPEPSPANVPLQQPAPSKIAQNVQVLQNHVEAQAQATELHETAVHNRLDLHEQKIDDVAQKVEEVKQVVASAPQYLRPQDLQIITMKINDLEVKLGDVSATSTAVLDLMKKILETDRKILVDLEAKK